MGRRKIDIRPILDERNRSVTLNKRKAGLFKKAHELAVLCQVDLALVVITQEGKVYEYSTAPSATEIFSRRQTLPIVEEKHPVDYGYSSTGTHNNLEDDDDSEAEDSPGNEEGSKHLKSSLLEHPSSRPRLKVHIPLANQDHQEVPGHPPGPLTALAVGAGIESSQMVPQHPSLARGAAHNAKSQSQAAVSTASDPLVDKHQQLHHPQQQNHSQPPHRHHQPQTQQPYLSQQRYAMPQFPYQQPYVLPHHQSQYTSQSQSQSQHPSSQKQHSSKEQNQQAQGQLPQGLALSPGGMYPSYHSTVGYGNVYNTVPYSYGSTSGYGLPPTTTTTAPAPAPAPPPLSGSTQQTSSSTSSKALPGAANAPAPNAPGAAAPNGPSAPAASGAQNVPGSSGTMPPPPPPPNGNDSSSSGGGQGQQDSSGRWGAYPNSPLNYYVPANNDQASLKPEAGPLTASIQQRYGNEMMMSPSNLLSMEWGVWDPGSRMMHPAGAGQPRGTNPGPGLNNTAANTSHSTSGNSSVNVNSTPNTSANSTIANAGSKIPSIHASGDKSLHAGEQPGDAEARKRAGNAHELTKNKWQKTS